jgi:hypothetical protein
MKNQKSIRKDIRFRFLIKVLYHNSYNIKGLSCLVQPTKLEKNEKEKNYCVFSTLLDFLNKKNCKSKINKKWKPLHSLIVWENDLNPKTKLQKQIK